MSAESGSSRPEAAVHGTPIGVLVIRWVARISGAGLFLLLASIAIGEGGPPNPWTQPWKVNLELHLMLTVWLGLLIGWKWEGIGGGMILVGMIAFLALEHRAPHGIAWPLLLPGLCYVFCRLVDRTECLTPSSTREGGTA